MTKRADREYSAAVSEVDGAEPVSCGLLAIGIATSLDGRKPDVLMSGINSGANIGTSAQHSGTVGAVIAALNPGFNGPVPGIAISTDEPDCDDDCVDAHYRRVAELSLGKLDSHPVSTMPIEAGTRLGPYEVIAPIGAGGMGEVYEAKDTRLDRTVAIKVLPEHLAESPEVRTRGDAYRQLGRVNVKRMCDHGFLAAG